MADLWTREQEIIVFNLFCKIPFQHSSKNHPEVIKIAKLIGRTPSAVNLKIGNFGSFDASLKAKGITGLTHASKLDKEIWDEFNGKWDELSYLSEKLIAELQHSKLEIEDDCNFDIPRGEMKEVTVQQRVNQGFFRKAVLASYRTACCITGLANTELLIASHIKPWKDSDDSEKTNPTNGLCLNALHDKAFDRGFITVDTNYVIHISNEIKDCLDGRSLEMYFKRYDNTKIILPDKFLPNKDFLRYHNDVIYESWK